MEVVYRLEAVPELRPEEFIDLLARSTLAERRPIDEVETIRGMLVHADVIVTARAAGLLVGISRAITDFHYCTYLSDLAVDQACPAPGHRSRAHQTHPRSGRNQHDADPPVRPKRTNLLSSRRSAGARLVLDDSASSPARPSVLNQSPPPSHDRIPEHPEPANKRNRDASGHACEGMSYWRAS